MIRKDNQLCIPILWLRIITIYQDFKIITIYWEFRSLARYHTCNLSYMLNKQSPLVYINCHLRHWYNSEQGGIMLWIANQSTAWSLNQESTVAPKSHHILWYRWYSQSELKLLDKKFNVNYHTEHLQPYCFLRYLSQKRHFKLKR